MRQPFSGLLSAIGISVLSKLPNYQLTQLPNSSSRLARHCGLPAVNICQNSVSAFLKQCLRCLPAKFLRIITQRLFPQQLSAIRVSHNRPQPKLTFSCFRQSPDRYLTSTAQAKKQCPFTQRGCSRIGVVQKAQNSTHCLVATTNFDPQGALSRRRTHLLRRNTIAYMLIQSQPMHS